MLLSRALRAGLAVAGVAVAAACAQGTNPLAGGDTGGSGGSNGTGGGGSGQGGAAATGAGGTHAGGSTTTTSSSTTSSTTTSSSTTQGGGGMGGLGPGGAGGGTGGNGGAPPGGCNINHLLVSEVRSRGIAGAADEFVELYNPTPSPVTLDATWTVDARSTSSGSYTARWKGGGGTIPAHGHYLIVGSTYKQSPDKDDGLSTGITDASSVRLTHSGKTVDAVCFGYDAASLGAFDATYDCEGTPVSNLPHNDGSNGQSNSDASIERKPGGKAGNCTDTNDNAADFAAAAPATPENSSSPPAP